MKQTQKKHEWFVLMAKGRKQNIRMHAWAT